VKQLLHQDGVRGGKCFSEYYQHVKNCGAKIGFTTATGALLL
jgi:hypothetical protein